MQALNTQYIQTWPIQTSNTTWYDQINITFSYSNLFIVTLSSLWFHAYKTTKDVPLFQIGTLNLTPSKNSLHQIDVDVMFMTNPATGEQLRQHHLTSQPSWEGTTGERVSPLVMVQCIMASIISRLKRAPFILFSQGSLWCQRMR